MLQNNALHVFYQIEDHLLCYGNFLLLLDKQQIHHMELNEINQLGQREQN